MYTYKGLMYVLTHRTGFHKQQIKDDMMVIDRNDNRNESFLVGMDLVIC